MFMTIAQQLKTADRPLISVEFFSPTTDAGQKAFDRAAQALTGLKTDFVSVTCGAGGSAAGPTLEICRQLAGLNYRSIMPHCTCVGMSRTDLEILSDAIVGQGIQHIMALRGDPPRGESTFRPVPDGFRYAAQLVAFLRDRHPGLCIGVAGYPEKHPEADSLDEDIRHLKEKVDAGADLITTQLFLDTQVYFDFVDRCRSAGITVPVLPGLLPVTSLQQIKRMQTFCDFHVPEKLQHDLQAVQDNPAKAERIGLYWVMEQISELVEGGSPGIHLYLLNRAQTVFYPELFACLSRVRGKKANG